MVKVEFFAEVSAAERRAILATLESFKRLEDLVAWGFTQRPIRSIEDIIPIQDAFATAIVPFSDQLYMAVRLTPEATIVGGSIWDHFPSAADLEAADSADEAA